MEGRNGLEERALQLESRRQQAMKQLQEAIQRECQGAEPSETDSEKLLWNTLILFQDCVFETAKKLQYTYCIRGYEMFVSRKDKSITRSTVNLAFGMAVKLLKEGLPITGPKKLGTFGASYLYPIFIRIGVIPVEKTRKVKKAKAPKQSE